MIKNKLMLVRYKREAFITEYGYNSYYGYDDNCAELLLVYGDDIYIMENEFYEIGKTDRSRIDIDFIKYYGTLQNFDLEELKEFYNFYELDNFKNKISLYELESNLKFTCDDFTRNRHINKLDSFDNYADQLEYVELFDNEISLESFLGL